MSTVSSIPIGRVLLVGTYLTEAHNHSVGEELGERLRQSGWKVTMTSHSTGRLARLVDMLATVWRARREYDVAQVDVYSGKAFIWAEVVCVLLRYLGKPYVLTLHGGNLPSFASRWPARVRRLLHSAAVVTTPSRYLMEEMAPYGDRLRLLPNAVDLGAYPFRLRERPEARLVWVRAFHQMYNPALAVEVVAMLRRDFPALRLVMVGPEKDGSLARMKERAETLGVRDAIEFTGGVPHHAVVRRLQHGEIFLNTTNVDNAPVSVLEAMACGLPVVSTSAGGMPYLLQEGLDALLVPPNDADAMAAAVRRILSGDELGSRLSRAGRATVETLSWKFVLPDWKAVLMEAKCE